jgi:hypothetical protein
MKKIYFILFCCTLFTTGCGIREREEALEKKENEINQKEQRLLLLEKQLELKENDLAQLQRSLDSTNKRADSLDTGVINTKLVGNWTVTMRCTATTCEGSAVGDTKNEQWEFAYQGTTVIAKASADNKLVRVYSGVFKENSLELTAQHEPEAPNTKITVKLTPKNDLELDGTREIVRADVCNIVYAMTLKKI